MSIRTTGHWRRPLSFAVGAGRRKTLTGLTLAGLLGTLSTVVHAQVYRCGDSYQQSPCEGGRQVQVDDPRHPEQQRAALIQAEA